MANIKNFNKATAYFRQMEYDHPDEKQWGEFAEAMDDVISTFVPVVRCKDCKHRPKEPDFETYESGFDFEFPEGSKCPCRCSGDEWYSWYPEDDWFCADGERKNE